MWPFWVEKGWGFFLFLWTRASDNDGRLWWTSPAILWLISQHFSTHQEFFLLLLFPYYSTWLHTPQIPSHTTWLFGLHGGIIQKTTLLEQFMRQTKRLGPNHNWWQNQNEKSSSLIPRFPTSIRLHSASLLWVNMTNFPRDQQAGIY